MSDPVFLTAGQVEAYHARGLELYGGSEGLRNRSLFESAVAQAQNVYWYANGDLYDIAAAYCFHIAQRQVQSRLKNVTLTEWRGATDAL